MIKPFLLLAVGVLVMMTAAARAEGPLVVTPAADWTVKFTRVPSECYTLVPPPKQAVDFAFSRWAVPGTPDQIPGYLDTMAKGLIENSARNPKIKLDSTDYTQGEFIGDPYSGKFVEFSLKDGLKDVLFMFGDNTGLWYGHYIGTGDGWLDAMEVLKAIKKA